MSLNVQERRREMGVLRAIGASPGTVCLIVVLEGGVIGLLSWALATVAAGPFSKIVGNFVMTLMANTDLDFAFEPVGIVVLLATSAFLATAASFFPAWQAARRPVREAIGYE
jgi:putative ABC transport system permease protein